MAAQPPRVLTFFSYKGGVGRTLAALHVAYCLAKFGRRVLLVDLDLEAPGLSSFLRQPALSAAGTADALDLVTWALRRQQNEALPAPGAMERSTQDLARSAADAQAFTGCLEYILVDLDRHYISRLDDCMQEAAELLRFEQPAADLRHALESLAPTLSPIMPSYYTDAKAYAREEPLPYEFVVVDSRTGITNLSGLCVCMADCLVILSGLNAQNIEGTAAFLGEILPEDEEQRKPAVLVASPVPAGELDIKGRRREEFVSRLGRCDVELTYQPYLAVAEGIFFEKFPDEQLTHQYRQLTLEVLSRFNEDPRRLLARCTQGLDAGLPARGLVQELEWLSRMAPDIAEPVVSLVLRDRGSPSLEEWMARDRLHRALCEATGFREDVVLEWARELVAWAREDARNAPSLAAARRAQARLCLERLSSASEFAQQAAAAEIGELAVLEGDEDLALRQLSGVAERATSQDGAHWRALLASVLCTRARLRAQSAPAEALEDAQQAAQIASSISVRSLAQALLVQAELTADHKAAIALLSRVVEMYDIHGSVRHVALIRRGVLHGKMGNLEDQRRDEERALELFGAWAPGPR